MRVGDIIGNHRILNEIGLGGMGAVYLAEHTLIGRRAAIKVLLPEFSQNTELVQRFFNEAKAATAINSAGIVEIYDFGFHDDGSAYIVMELLQGEELKDRLKRIAPLPLAHALHLTRQIAGTLDAAHESGVIHRDLKPGNVFVVPDREVPGGERVKLLDFGIAKLTKNTGDGALKTRTGMVMGTPTYMAPEQCKGAGDVDCRADLYSLGCMLFEMVCGKPPFTAAGAGEIMAQQILTPPPVPSTLNPSLPRPVDELILSLLAKDPALRPPNAHALIAMLDSLQASLWSAEQGRGHAQMGAPNANSHDIHDSLETTPGAATNGVTLGPQGPQTTLSSSVSVRAKSVHSLRLRHLLAVPVIAVLVIGLAGGIYALWTANRGDTEQTPAAASGHIAPPPLAMPTTPPTTRDDTEPIAGPIAKPIAGPITEPGTADAAMAVSALPQPAADASRQADDKLADDKLAGTLADTLIDIRVRSTPTGALVYEGDSRIGKTPLTVQVSSARPRTYELRRRGYRSATIVLPEAADGRGTVSVKLARVPKDVNSQDQESQPVKPKQPDKPGRDEILDWNINKKEVKP